MFPASMALAVNTGGQWSGDPYGHGGAISGGTYVGSTSSNNTVNVDSLNSMGVLQYVYGGENFSGDSSNNTVTVVDVVVPDAGIYGGFSQGGTSSNNTVTIDGATVKTVSGGYRQVGSTPTINNLVILKNNARVSESISGGDASTGNTLQMWQKNTTVKYVTDFENYQFILPTDMAAGETVLTLTGGQQRTCKIPKSALRWHRVLHRG